MDFAEHVGLNNRAKAQIGAISSDAIGSRRCEPVSPVGENVVGHESRFPGHYLLMDDLGS